MRIRNALVPFAAVGLAAACSGSPSGEAAPATTTTAAAEVTTTTEVINENPLCVALYGLEGALAEGADPTSSIAEVEGALGVTEEGYPIVAGGPTVEQLGDVLGATSTSELVASNPGEEALVTQALEATGTAIASNGCQPFDSFKELFPYL